MKCRQINVGDRLWLACCLRGVAGLVRSQLQRAHGQILMPGCNGHPLWSLSKPQLGT